MKQKMFTIKKMTLQNLFALILNYVSFLINKALINVEDH